MYHKFIRKDTVILYLLRLICSDHQVEIILYMKMKQICYVIYIATPGYFCKTCVEKHLTLKKV